MIRKGKKRYRNKYRGKKSDGTRYKTGIYFIFISLAGVILGFVLPWAKVLGDELLSALLDLALGDLFVGSDFFVMLFVILFSGAILIILNFLEDVELISALKSSWAKLVLANILVVLSIYFIFISLYYLGVMISFNRFTIMSEDIDGILFTPAPLAFAAIGVFMLNISMGAIKKESSALKFKT